MDRSTQTDKDHQSFSFEAVSASGAQLPEAPANPRPETVSTPEDRTILSSIFRSPHDPAIATTSAVADSAPDPACSQRVRESYGTAIEFLSQPTEAARQALHDNKLLFLLHVSGNFEEAKFT
jgi:hypothetical protein